MIFWASQFGCSFLEIQSKQKETMRIEKYFVANPSSLSDWQMKLAAKRLMRELDDGETTAFRSLSIEACYYVIRDSDERLNEDEEEKLCWLLRKPLWSEVPLIKKESFFGGKNVAESKNFLLLEFGPRLSFTTPFSTNAVSACRSAGLSSVIRLEQSLRYLIYFDGIDKEKVREKAIRILHDRMTECEYARPPDTFESNVQPQRPFTIDLLGRGLVAFEEANRNLGLAFDEDDMKYYLHLFCNLIQRNPTNVELFDLAQSNSEHSRHWFFKGRLNVEGKEESASLFQMVMDTQKYSNSNNVIKFCDNSSGIQGFATDFLIVKEPTTDKAVYKREASQRHLIYTAETHNFPTGVCPFPGAATGTGGRIRDVHAAGRGAHVIAGVAGYSFGNLNIPGYQLPWEDPSASYPPNFASPLDICIQASNGASDYGNKFGEPVICGFARSFGMRVAKSGGSPTSERIEWIKPIMFSGGVGSIDDEFLRKEAPTEGMHVVKLGGPVYRIGVGGGSASSVHVQGDQKRNEELDFGAVQRGDPEMEQKLNRVIRSCVEMGDGVNPIASIHDQGAGGNGNVLKEIVEGAGAVIESDKFELGDRTINILELWGAEYQESDAILVRPENEDVLKRVCERERCPVSFVGRVSNDNVVILKDFTDSRRTIGDERNPVELPLDKVLASMPPKVFHLNRTHPLRSSLEFPADLSVRQALERVLRLPSVASKRYLTNKVDRSVTGLIAQQQCVGPLHTPVADVAVVALSYFDTVGTALALGEQPIKGLVNPEAGARMAVGEALTNLVFAPITCLKDVKCSANWMWPAKLAGEGAALLGACKAMCRLMNELGIAVDGGKDSLSMAARVGDEVVKAPGTLVISAYAPCTDITNVVTPDLKCPDGKGVLLHVRFGNAHGNQLGGTALGQCFGQLGIHCPDVDNPKLFADAFTTTQKLIKDGLICSGHDVSDGGLATTLLEMAFAGNCSINIQLTSSNGNDSPLNILFSEEPGIVVEVKASDVERVTNAYAQFKVPCVTIGESRVISGEPQKINIEMRREGSGDAEALLTGKMVEFRSMWEETSFELEKLQCNERCAIEEQQVLETFTNAKYRKTATTGAPKRPLVGKAPLVAIIREEGSNGDREMAAAFSMAGFDAWDVCMQDLLYGRLSLDRFRGVAFVGGFSYADVLGSAKGWASSIMFNENARREFNEFAFRENTFSLGVCNGCQLMCLLGWIGTSKLDGSRLGSNGSDIFLDHNESGRFESRFSTVKLYQSPSIMLKGMENSTLGVWVSHGEGKFIFNDEVTHREMLDIIPIRYVDDTDWPTMRYPLNPNGSMDGIAGLCSRNGRHLAFMPHPERSFLTWQWPYWPGEWGDERRGGQKESAALMSPWFKMFENAFEWCSGGKEEEK